MYSLAEFEEDLLSTGVSQFEKLKFDKSCGVSPLRFDDAILIARK
jgi:hypothetical protein